MCSVGLSPAKIGNQQWTRAVRNGFILKDTALGLSLEALSFLLIMHLQILPAAASLSYLHLSLLLSSSLSFCHLSVSSGIGPSFPFSIRRMKRNEKQKYKKDTKDMRPQEPMKSHQNPINISFPMQIPSTRNIFSFLILLIPGSWKFCLIFS